MEIVLRKEYSKFIIYWLISLLVFIGLIVVVGGLTRLTDSGLSITTWDVVSGILPPLNNEQWENVFALYKEIPQFYLLNQNMTLSEFKVIYYWEYIHRVLGRVLGLMYMVKSGLVHDVTVSHYRLAIHLNLALILFSAIYWYFLNITFQKNKIFFNISNSITPKIFILLIFLQITFGAFTSGLDAGKIYQTWPLMNNYFYPDDLNTNDITIPQILNEPSFVQFIHRKLAYIIFLYVLFMTFFIFYKKDKEMYKSTYLLLITIFVQIFLGIITLLSGAYIWIASLHQFSTILLLLSSIYFYYNSLKT